MSNIDLFHLFAAKTFAILYEKFPVFEAIAPEALVDQGNEIHQEKREVASATLKWLFEAGYVIRIGESSPFRYTLSSKGFEILDADPFGKSDKQKKSLGEQFITLLKDSATNAVKEEIKLAVKKVIGKGIALGIAAIV